MKKPKVIIVMPARNSAKTLEKTYNEIPKEFRKHILLADNASKDDTISIARSLGIKIIKHQKDIGYGGSQKDLYKRALKDRADIVVMLHPDYQYDGRKIPSLIEPIIKGEADFVMGSRILGDGAKTMPLYKFIGNRILTVIENFILGINISELHSGMRAYNRKLLETMPFMMNSDDYVFDSEFIVQTAAFGFRFSEIGVPTRYFKEASSINPKRAFKYGATTLVTLLKFILHKYGIKKYKQFGK